MDLQLSSLRFSLILLWLICAAAFALHFYIWQEQGWGLHEHRLLAAYLFNPAVATAMLIFLHKAPSRYLENLGFVYMGGTALAFIGFFVFFYPGYRADGSMSRAEFAAFFTPYAISLAYKTLVFVRQLNRPAD